MKPFSHLDQVAFSDLSTQVFDADFSENFQGNGSFFKQKRGNAEYYYFKSYKIGIMQKFHPKALKECAASR